MLHKFFLYTSILELRYTSAQNKETKAVSNLNYSQENMFLRCVGLSKTAYAFSH